MIPLAIFRAIPLTAWLVAGVLAAAALYHWRATNAAYEAGKATATETIRAANEASEKRADKAERNPDFSNCPLGKWNRRTGTCEP
jgi:hypothetical protein